MSQPPPKKSHTVLWVASALLVVAGLAALWVATSSAPSEPLFALPSPEAPAAMSPVDTPMPGASPTTLPPAEPATVQPETSTPTPVPSPTAAVLTVALPDDLPPDLREGVLGWIAQQPDTRVVSDTQGADLWISAEAGGAPLAERIYVPVTRYGNLQDDVSSADLLAMWMTGAESGQPGLLVDANAAAGLSMLWGAPQQLDIAPDGAAIAATLDSAPQRYGVLPFDELVPAAKALSIGGMDATDNQFDAAAYPLALRLFLHSKPEASAQAASLQGFIAEQGLATNRDPEKMTVLIMTGVTAMARTTALRMEQKGYGYPAAEIGPLLSAADITHISNEVPFTPNCVVDASENNLVLCSSPEYLQAMRDVGVDIVGLTGNHLNDYGKEDSLWSVQFYKDQELPTYGGGANLEESLKPLLVQHNGNRLVFLGANSFGPQFALAEPDWPGSAPYDEAQMIQAIADAREKLNGDVVLVETQWEESYDTLPIQTQIDGFETLSAAGADIVTGVQSHVPQAVEFTDNGLILYGLGNLFFDQMWSEETRQGLIPRHTIYDGRHLSTKLLTTVLEDFAQPRWATEEERQAILSRVFTASGW